MASTGKWEYVAKPNKRRPAKQPSTKAQRAALQENMPRIDPVPPVKESATIYDAFIAKEQKEAQRLSGKEHGKPPGNDVHKKPNQPRKKPDRSKKEQVSVSLKEALSQVDINELETILLKDQAAFPGNPSVWLKDLASYLSLKLDHMKETDPVFSSMPIGYPASELSEPVRKLLVSTLSDCPQESLELFLEHCVQSMIGDLNKAIPSFGYKIFIQLLAMEKPDVVAGDLSKYSNIIQSSRIKLFPCLSVLWAVGQCGLVSLSTGIQVWYELMFPLLHSRDMSIYVVEYIEKIFSYHPDVKPAYNAIDFRKFFPIMDQVFSVNSNLSSYLRKKLLAVYPKLKEIAYGSTVETNMRHFFPSFLTRLTADCKKSLEEELVSCLMFCLTRDKHCYSVWRQMYTKHMAQSSLLMQYIHDHWDTYSRQLDRRLLKETVSAFSVTNSDLAAQGKTGMEGFTECVQVCKDLLKKTDRSAFPVVFFMLMLMGAGLIAGVGYDVYSSKGFKNSRTRQTLHDYGVLIFLEQVWIRVKHYTGTTMQWCQTNIPQYFTRACEVLGPYTQLLWEKLYAFGTWFAEVTKPQQDWLKQKGPLVLEWFQSHLPVVWSFLSYYLGIILKFTTTYGLLLWQHLVDWIHIAGTWLQNVFS